METSRLHLGSRSLVALLALTAAACSSSSTAPTNPTGGGVAGDADGSASGYAEPAGLPPVDTTGPLGGDRPVDIVAPEGATAEAPRPLVVLLHGRTATGPLQDAFLGFSRRATAAGYFFLAPTGTKDKSPREETFWNATDACCDLSGTGVDDVAYIRDLIRGAIARYPVDPRRIYLFGHSNGGFLAHRMACDHAWLITGIVNLAGSTWADASKCSPTAPVSVLNVHGTADETIRFGGGQLTQNPARTPVPYPSALEATTRWGGLNGCSGELTEAPARRDFDTLVAGEDTTLLRYASCPKTGAAELWRIDGGGHLPLFQPAFLDEVFAFFEAHARP